MTVPDANRSRLFSLQRSDEPRLRWLIARTFTRLTLEAYTMPTYRIMHSPLKSFPSRPAAASTRAPLAALAGNLGVAIACESPRRNLRDVRSSNRRHCHRNRICFVAQRKLVEDRVFFSARSDIRSSLSRLCRIDDDRSAAAVWIGHTGAGG